MTDRRPLVVINGQASELPVTDNLIGYDRVVAQAARAGTSIVGGGVVTFASPGKVRWSQRFIQISGGRGQGYAAYGYYEFQMPADGVNILGVGGAASRAVSGGYINLNTWEALYGVPIVSGGFDQVSYAVSSYTGDVSIPPHWVPLVRHSGDTNRLHLPNGHSVAFGDSVDTAATQWDATNNPKATPADLAAGVSTTAGVRVADVGSVATAIVLPRSELAAPNLSTMAQHYRRGLISSEAWMPKAQWANIRNGVGVLRAGNGVLLGAENAGAVDLTSACQSAASSGQDIWWESGGYRITDRIALSSYGQAFKSADAGTTTFLVMRDANLATSGYIATNSGGYVDNIGVDFDQVFTRNRGQLIDFPAAFDGLTSSGATLSNILVQRGMRGYNGNANCGQVNLENWRCGVLSYGAQIDGALDFVKANNFHVWPFGMTTIDELMHAYYDGLVCAMDIGQCEAIAFGSIQSFCATFVLRAGRNGGLPFGTIGSICMDAGGATLVSNAGFVSIGSHYSTKNGTVEYEDSAKNKFRNTNPATAQSIRVNGGQLSIGSAVMDVNGPVADTDVSNGSLTIGAGQIRQHSSDNAWGVAGSGGRISVSRAVEFLPHNGFTQARTQPYLVQNAGGSISNDASFPWRNGPGSPDSGLAAYFYTNDPSNYSRKLFGGWSVAPPPGGTAAQYGENY